MIEVRDLVKRYGRHLAVDHLSFTVPDGQIFGFLGPNGAGKSTTMNLMTGYLGPTEGEILVDGHSVTQEPEKAKQAIGYLPEQPPLYLDMTAEEYLEFAARLKKVPKGDRGEQTARVMELTGITGVRGRLLRNLSKGYRQRVGLAQALLGFPKVLILDEPTVGLDPQQIIEIRTLIRGSGPAAHGDFKFPHPLRGAGGVRPPAHHPPREKGGRRHPGGAGALPGPHSRPGGVRRRAPGAGAGPAGASARIDLSDSSGRQGGGGVLLPPGGGGGGRPAGGGVPGLCPL